MAQKTYAELIAEAELIRDETATNANTATRVGSTLIDMIDFGSISQSIPIPLIGIQGNGTSGILEISFGATDFDFTKGNPEIFLMRYRNTRKKMKFVNGVRVWRYNKAGYIHPSDATASSKWQGWKFFGGSQKIRILGELFETPRTTEFPITIATNYDIMNISLNRFMFWSLKDYANDIVTSDVNIFPGELISRTNNVPSNDINLKVSIGGFRHQKTGLALYTKLQEFALCVAVDNPFATKTNGMCPKILGQISQPFNSILVFENTGKNAHVNDVQFILKRTNYRSKIRSIM